jgi:hypothetical protein
MQAGELGLDSDSDDNSKTEPVGSAIQGRKRKPNDANASTDTTRADAQAETNPGVSEGSAAPKAKSLRLNRLRGWPDLQCADACLFNLTSSNAADVHAERQSCGKRFARAQPSSRLLPPAPSIIR